MSLWVLVVVLTEDGRNVVDGDGGTLSALGLDMAAMGGRIEVEFHRKGNPELTALVDASDFSVMERIQRKLSLMKMNVHSARLFGPYSQQQVAIAGGDLDDFNPRRLLAPVTARSNSQGDIKARLKAGRSDQSVILEEESNVWHRRDNR